MNDWIFCSKRHICYFFDVKYSSVLYVEIVFIIYFRNALRIVLHMKLQLSSKALVPELRLWEHSHVSCWRQRYVCYSLDFLLILLGDVFYALLGL